MSDEDIKDLEVLNKLLQEETDEAERESILAAIREIESEKSIKTIYRLASVGADESSSVQL